MKTCLPNLLRVTAACCVLAGCVAVPYGPNGEYAWAPLQVPPGGPGAPGAPAGIPGSAAMPAVLHARLYPANDAAATMGVLTGTVTNMMNGKGRFQLAYGDDMLVGEATRVDGDARRGVASAFGPRGGFMSCEYQMNTPRQGAGTCSFNNGALYRVHIGV